MTAVQDYAVIDASGQVVNLIRWDGLSKWSPPDGCTVVPATDAHRQSYTAWREAQDA